MMTLHPYQETLVTHFENVVSGGCNRVLAVAPTGAGKTIVFSTIAKKYAEQFKTVIVLAHRREIVKQTSEKLFRCDVRHGIIQAGFENLARPMERVQVASVQTLTARAVRTNRMPLPPADLIVIDEAHHVVADTYKKIIEAYPNATLLGLTATPCRGDGRGLGNVFQEMIEAPQIPELIGLGFLVGTKVYAPCIPDLRGVRTTAGDYNVGQLAERMDRAPLIGDIISHWLRLGESRKTVAFATSVEHSVHIRDEFIRAGVRAEHIDGGTPKPERDQTLARLASGELQVVSNCAVLTEGWDCPEASCCILARPTKSFGLFRQMIGRTLRPAEGKSNALILDHSGAVYRHGLVEDLVEWTLDPDHKAEAKAHTSAGHNFESSSRLIECSQCSAIRTAGEACPHCGFLPRRPARPVPVGAGELGLVNAHRQATPTTVDRATKMRWWAMLTHIGQERGYKPGWAAHQFKTKFGDWPGRAVEPLPPSPEVTAWVRHRMIRFAKSRRRVA